MGHAPVIEGVAEQFLGAERRCVEVESRRGTINADLRHHVGAQRTVGLGHGIPLRLSREHRPIHDVDPRWDPHHLGSVR